MNVESEVLVNLGKEALNSGDFQKAIDLLQRAQNLHPDPNTEKLLQKARKSLTHTKTPAFNSEDEQVIKKIMQKSNFYEILEVDKSASQEQIKKAYQKLARKVHPDKNQAPAATQAFTRLQKAYECLTDENRKAHYDEFEEDNESNFNPEFSFSRENIQVIVAGVLFNSIISPNHFVHKWYKEEENKIPSTKLGFKLLSLIFILSLMVLSWMSQEEKLFSLQQSPYFNTVYQSQKIGFEFYVNDRVAKNLAESFEGLQKEAENFYLAGLQKQCQKTKTVKKEILAKMKNTDSMNSKLYQHYANTIDQSACNRLEEIFKVSKSNFT